ncbi:MAG: radical SAM protein [Patescibacteria group bacterium]|nr:radical SAM protein [Patescibacteria group bacterium]
MNSRCQWSCNFCHGEGSFTSADVNTQQLIDALLKFREYFGFNEVHFTGGEPTLNEDLPAMISAAHDLGFVTKLTSNGYHEIRRYLKCIDAGLNEINISLHTLNGAGLANIMYPRRPQQWGERAVARQLDLIHTIEDKIKVKINTVVTYSEKEALEIVGWIKNSSPKIEWRLADALSLQGTAYAAIDRVLNKLSAKALAIQITRGCSSASISLEDKDGFKFKVKRILPFKLDPLCKNCPLDERGGCNEYFYGPRLENVGGELSVRSCLYRSEHPYTIPINDYFLTEIAKNLKTIIG